MSVLLRFRAPEGVRLLAGFGGLLPPLFDEQVRHIGSSAGPLPDEENAHGEWSGKHSDEEPMPHCLASGCSAWE